MDPGRTSSRILPFTAGMLAVPAGVGAAMVLVTSDQVRFPAATASLTVWAAWAFVGAGVVACVSRPGNRTGPLMVIAGLFLLAGSLSAADEPVAFTLGVLVAPLSTGVFAPTSCSRFRRADSARRASGSSSGWRTPTPPRSNC